GTGGDDGETLPGQSDQGVPDMALVGGVESFVDVVHGKEAGLVEQRQRDPQSFAFECGQILDETATIDVGDVGRGQGPVDQAGPGGKAAQHHRLGEVFTDPESFLQCVDVLHQPE